MQDMVTIEQEENNRSRWIKVFVPQGTERSSASIHDKQGAVLKRLALSGGHNAIDISHIEEYPISIKVETPYETILKEIKTTRQ
jgi:hypothetical protein